MTTLCYKAIVEDYKEKEMLKKRRCPQCGRVMKGDAPDKKRYFKCDHCMQRFFVEDNGEIINVMDRCKHKNRRDIEPEEWQAFEEGWRPDGWND